MEPSSPPQPSSQDFQPSHRPRKHGRSQEPEEPSKRHKNRSGGEKYGSSTEKHKHRDDRDVGHSKHRHRHHRHRHHKKRRREHAGASGDEVESGREDGEHEGFEGPKGQEDYVPSVIKFTEKDTFPHYAEQALSADFASNTGKSRVSEGSRNGLDHGDAKGNIFAEDVNIVTRRGDSSDRQTDDENLNLGWGRTVHEEGDISARILVNRHGDIDTLSGPEDTIGRRENRKRQDLEERKENDEKDGHGVRMVSRGAEDLITPKEPRDRRERRERGESHLEHKMQRERGRSHDTKDGGKSGGPGDGQSMKHDMDVNGYLVEDQKNAKVVEDEKEEGEILEDEETSQKVTESEIESGEIQTEEGSGRKDVGLDEVSSKGKLIKVGWNSPSVQRADSKSPFNKVLSAEKGLSDGRLQNAVCDGTFALQSVLGIAEAYDSDQGSEERTTECNKTSLKCQILLREAHSADNVVTVDDSFPTDQINFGYSQEVDATGKVEEGVSDIVDKGLESMYLGMISKDDVIDASSNLVKEENILGVSSLNKSHSLHIYDPELHGKREAQQDARNKVRKDDKGHPSSQDNYRDRKEKHPSNSREWPRMKESDYRERPSRSLSRDSIKDRHQKIRHTPPLEHSREKLKEVRLSGSPEIARGKPRRNRSRSNESAKDRMYGRKRSQSRDIEMEKHSGRGRSDSPNFKDRGSAQGTNGDRRRRSRSRDSAYSVRYRRDSCEQNDSSKWTRPRDMDARLVDRRRRSRSKEQVHEFRHHRDGREQGRRSRSRDFGRTRASGRDDFDRRRRSRSRESYRECRGNGGALSRYGRHEDSSVGRTYRDERVARDGHIENASKGEAQRTDRDLERGSFHARNHASREQDHRRAESSPKAESEVTREEEDQEEYQERVASQLAAQEDDDIERIKEERRRRRQAILEKYRQQQQQQQQQKSNSEEMNRGMTMDGGIKDLEAGTIQTSSPTPGMSAVSQQSNGGVAPVVSLDEHVSDATFTLGKGPLQNGLLPSQRSLGTGGLGEGTPKSEKSGDKFCDDIFGESPAGGRKWAKGDGLALDTSGLTDNWDDAEGYYCYRIGEVLDLRYEVASSHGRGVFSSVVRARDLKAVRGEYEEVAIKIIRSNELMFKAGQRELVILKKLSGADPDKKRHCVRLLSSFEYRNHLCLVFEPLHMNLREVLKKFGRNIGINLNAVRAYAKQLFIALKHLRNCGVLHCDIKPDNMLVNEAKNVLKLCDFGSAMFAGENEITPYLVSRFYRAPEIILGLPYDHALDIWSVGCCLYELYTGKVLFPGPTNNDMLRLHMELKGPFPKKMLKKAAFASQHFDQDYNFCAIEEDPVTKKTVKRVLINVKPKDVAFLITGSGTSDEDPKMLANFKDLLEKIFILDPDKRLTVSQALNHPFISGK